MRLNLLFLEKVCVKSCKNLCRSRIHKELERGERGSAENAFRSLLNMVSEHVDQIKESFKIDKVWESIDMKESFLVISAVLALC